VFTFETVPAYIISWHVLEEFTDPDLVALREVLGHMAPLLGGEVFRAGHLRLFRLESTSPHVRRGLGRALGMGSTGRKLCAAPSPACRLAAARPPLPACLPADGAGSRLPAHPPTHPPTHRPSHPPTRKSRADGRTVLPLALRPARGLLRGHR
jgi:hypothetical protein